MVSSLRRCHYCELACHPRHRYCPRCGGQVLEETMLERHLALLQRSRILLKNRVWRGLGEAFQLAKKLQTADPDLKVQCHSSLVWLGQDVQTFADHACGADLSRVFSVMKGVVPLLADQSLPQLRMQQGKLRTFFDSLAAGEKECGDRGAPPADKLHKWLHNLAGKASLDLKQAQSCLFATPERWPTLAAALDAGAFQQAASLLALARGEKELKEKNYGTAQKVFAKVLAKDPACVRALEGLAMTQVKLDNFAEAFRLYHEAIRAGATDPNTFNNLAWYLCVSGQSSEAALREALWAARRAVEIAPIAGIWDTLAEVHARLGELEAAIAATREAIRIDPERQSFRERMRSLCASLTAATAAADDDSSINLGEIPSAVGPKTMCGDSERPASEDRSAASVSGINLGEPFDLDEPSGAALSAVGPKKPQPKEDIEFEFSLEATEQAATSSDSEFELTLDADVDSSDFDLALEEADEIADAVEKPSTQRIPAGGRGSFAADAVQRDPVDCTVYAPPEVSLGDSLMVQVFAHMPQQAQQAREAAQEFDADAQRRGVTSLGTQIARHSKLFFELQFAGLRIDEPIQELIWLGRPDSVQFEVQVSAKDRPRTAIGKVMVSQEVAVKIDGKLRQGTVPIGEVKFKLKLTPAASATRQDNAATGEANRFTKAFISYASQDRKKVLERVQMLSAAGITFFQDVLDLDPGDRWSRELFRHIDTSDVLFLFWSRWAKESKWVEKEWRYGLEKKGDEFIRPVIIEGPPIVAPPEELAHLHFNDKVLYFIQAS